MGQPLMSTTVGSPPAESPPTVRRTPRLVGGVVAGLVALASIVLTFASALNGDVAYALGGIETAGRGGVRLTDIFIARPVAYKLLVGGMDDLQALLSGDAAQPTQEAILRIETIVLVALVTAVLYAGVRRLAGPRAAAGVAVATGLALIVAPPWHFLEPDWVAVLAGVLAVGAACAPRRLWLGALLGGVGAMLVVAMKLATIPLALLALILIGLFSLRRAIWSAVSTAGFVALWYVLTKQLLPWEWIWLQDQADLVHDSPIHHGIRWVDIHHLLTGIGDVTILSPFVVLAPAAAAVLIRRLPAGRPRWVAAVTAVVAAGLSVAPAYGQGEFFMYHFAPLPVLAAAVWGGAFALCPTVRIPLSVLTVAAAAGSYVLLRRDPQWRLDQADHVTIAVFAVAAVLALLLWVTAGRLTISGPWAVGVISLCAALVQASIPGTPYAFSSYNRATPVTGWSGQELVDLSERLGRDTPVLYLSFGAVNHNMGNPTSCRYPSPQWLQRGATIPDVRTYRSYADNLRCLTDDKDAKYLVWQQKWFYLSRSSPEVRSLINARFDCSAAARVPAPEHFVVCPAKP
jgi:hypothetical protein